MKFPAFAIVILLPLSAAAAPAERLTPEQFTWQQAIEVDGREAIYRFELPRSVHSDTRRDQGDLRIFNAAGEVVPHALLEYTPPAERSLQTTALNHFPVYRSATTATGVTIDVRQRTDGSLISARVDTGRTPRAGPGLAGYLLDASAIKRPVVALIAEWQEQAQGTVIPVQVEASDDLQNWRSVSRNAQLVDLSYGGQRLRRNRIELDGTAARYWRLTWPADREAIALSSIAAETSTQVERPRPLRWDPATALRSGEKAGEFLFESGGLTVESLRLALPQANTVTPIRIFHRDKDRDPWREAANTIAYRLERNGGEIVAPPIAICCSNDRLWMIAFDQRGGGIGAGMPQVELGWVPRQLLFVARGTAPFRLAYGNRNAMPTNFSAATLVPGYRPEDFPKLPEARLGTATRAAATATTEAFPGPADAANWRSIGLWGILVLGVLGLGGMTWHLLREMNRKTDGS